jgi:hypothetical protein
MNAHGMVDKLVCHLDTAGSNTSGRAVAETAASQRLMVADLDRKSAEQKKLELILLGFDLGKSFLLSLLTRFIN